MSTGIMTTPGCKNMEAELAALLPLDNDKVNPRHPAPARTPTQSAGLSRVAYVSIALTLVLAAFLLGKFNRPYTTQTDDAAFNRAMDAGVRLTAAEEKALSTLPALT